MVFPVLLYLLCEVTDMESIVVEMVTIIQRREVASETTDYSSDKKVRVLQTAKLGKGLPIVLMGDGFIDTEINDGTYDAVMDKAFENLFTEEPIKSLRDYFNVYAVTAVSKHNILVQDMKQRLVVNWRVETVRGFPVKIMLYNVMYNAWII